MHSGKMEEVEEEFEGNKRLPNESEYDLCIRACEKIKSVIGDKPEIGLVLGTGMHVISDEIQDPKTIKYEDIPGFHPSTHEPHLSVLIYGTIEGRKVILLKYRVHFYEGRSMNELVFPIRVFGMLGVENILLTNAAGSINKSYRPGDYMILEDHINFSGKNPLMGKNEDRWGMRFIGCEDIYDRKINREFFDKVNEWKKTRVRGEEEEDFRIHRGCYMMWSGPSFETPSEIIMGRTIGADVAGMSTVPEALVAQHMDITVTAFSFIANYGAGTTDVPVEHEKVCQMAGNMALVSRGLVKLVIPLMKPNPEKKRRREEYLEKMMNKE